MRLLADGHSVLAVDDLSSGRLENLGPGCLLATKDRPPDGPPDAIGLWLGNAADRDLVCPLVCASDFVFHLAATVGVFQYMQQSVRTILNNIEATAVVMELCAAQRKPCLFTSTSEVYGKTNKLPFHEDDDIVFGPSTKPRWAYAASKYADELLALGYHRERGLPVRVVRLFNVVGLRQTGRYGMVVPRFVAQAKADEPLTVFDTGKQTRTFCLVHDVIDGLVKLMNFEAAVGKVVNLGSDVEISINRLAYAVLDVVHPDLVGAPSCVLDKLITHVPYAEAYGEGFDETPRRVPDLSRARELIGWDPKWMLGDLLKDFAGESS